MATTDPVQFSHASAQRIARAVKRIEAMPHNGRGRGRATPGTLGRDRWFGITATCDEFPDYPPEPPATADTYCVRLVERFFSETPGYQPQTQLLDNRHVIARLACPTSDRRWLPEGTEVEVYRIPTRRGPRYYCRPLAEQERLFELTQRLRCGESAEAVLLLGPNLAAVDNFTFVVADNANLVGNLNPDPQCFAEVGTRGIAKYFHDRGSWDVISLGQCLECESSSSESSSSSSSSESSSESSESESSESSDPPSESSDECAYTGSITVGRGNLHRVGDSIFESLVTLRFEAGKLCSFDDAGEANAYVCCDSESSSESSSDSSSEPSSSDSSSEPPSESSSEPPSESSSTPPSESSDEPPSESSSTPPSESSDEPPSESSSTPASESSSEATECEGNCLWVAVDDPESSSAASESSGDECNETNCGEDCEASWVAINSPLGVVWSKTSDCAGAGDCSGCRPYYPLGQPSFVGDVCMSPCGCGCGNCAHVWHDGGWYQVAGCADYANPDCDCPMPPGLTGVEGDTFAYECGEGV